MPLLDWLGIEVAEACQQLTSGDDDIRMLTHRDFHDKQLLWDGITLGLLDLDIMACSKAALDLGNLWAHVELRHAQRSLGVQERDRILALLLGGLAGALPTTPDHVAAYCRTAQPRPVFVYASWPRPVD